MVAGRATLGTPWVLFNTLAFEVKTATPRLSEQIAVYGTDSACVASRSALRLLVESGYYTPLFRWAQGLGGC